MQLLVLFLQEGFDSVLALFFFIFELCPDLFGFFLEDFPLSLVHFVEHHLRNIILHLIYLFANGQVQLLFQLLRLRLIKVVRGRRLLNDGSKPLHIAVEQQITISQFKLIDFVLICWL